MLQFKTALQGTAVSLISILIAVIAIEYVGINFLFDESRLFWLKDVDHRMKPGTLPDLNSDGIRSAVEASDFRAEDRNIIFLGDSFVFGDKLTREEAIPFVLQEKARKLQPGTRINVANFGWVSSSPLLSDRLLRDIGSKYNPDTVILAVDMTDFHDDLKVQRLLERDGSYRLLDTIPITFWMTRKIMSLIGALDPLYQTLYGYPIDRFFITSRPLEETLPYFSAIRSSIESINAYAVNELGARFILYVFPRNYQYSDRESPNSWERSEYESLGPYVHEPFEYFEAMRGEVDFPIHSLLADFQETTVFPTCFDNDPHWNRDGARVAVEGIYQRCLEDGCFD